MSYTSCTLNITGALWIASDDHPSLMYLDDVGSSLLASADPDSWEALAAECIGRANALRSKTSTGAGEADSSAAPVGDSPCPECGTPVPADIAECECGAVFS